MRIGKPLARIVLIAALAGGGVGIAATMASAGWSPPTIGQVGEIGESPAPGVHLEPATDAVDTSLGR